MNDDVIKMLERLKWAFEQIRNSDKTDYNYYHLSLRQKTVKENIKILFDLTKNTTRNKYLIFNPLSKKTEIVFSNKNEYSPVQLINIDDHDLNIFKKIKLELLAFFQNGIYSDVFIYPNRETLMEAIEPLGLLLDQLKEIKAFILFKKTKIKTINNSKKEDKSLVSSNKSKLH